jgi:hypothetical protein
MPLNIDFVKPHYRMASI